MIRIGVPVDDYEKLSTLFQNVKDLDYEPKAMINLFLAHKDLSKQKKELTASVEALTDQNAQLSE